MQPHEPQRTESASEPFWDVQIYGGMTPDGEQADGASPDDDPMHSPENQADYRQIYEWWTQARLVHSENRYQQAIDEDFYDGMQWDENDKQVLASRGQAALVFNEIKPTIDWIIGAERRAKVDFHVFPRDGGDRQAAEVKTKLLKYTDDVNHTQHARSLAFADAVKVGIGWVEDGVRSDPTDEPIFSRRESWRNMWHDHLATEYDNSDARYTFRAKWTDEDVAIAYFPNQAHKIKSAAHAHDIYGGTDDDEFFLNQLYYQTDSQGRPIGRRTFIEDAEFAVQNRRRRVKMVECWYRKPEKAKVMRVHDEEHLPKDGNVIWSDDAQGMAEAQALTDEGIASLYDAVRMRVWVAIFVEGALLKNQPSPYKHDKFPFTPVWAYRRGRDGMPYGVIRNQRDPQEDMNKRRSKAQHILNTRQIVMEEGAVADKEELREEAASPDAIITLRRGTKRFDMNTDNTLAAQHVELEMRDREYIRSSGGVTAENLGQETNATSGRAITARQEEGAVVTTELFDNLYFTIQLQGEKRLSLVEQYMDFPKIVRIVGDEGEIEHLALNKPTWNPGGYVEVENDITASKADFRVDRTDYRASVREAMLAQLMEMAQKLPPEMMFQILDLIVEQWDVKNKDAIVARIRKLNGQPDPTQEGTPEAEAEKQAREAAEAENAGLQKRLVEAEVALKEAQARDTQQKALRNAVEVLRGLTEQSEALAITPELAAVIDELQAHVQSLAAEMPSAPEAPPGAAPGQPPQQPAAPMMAG